MSSDFGMVNEIFLRIYVQQSKTLPPKFSNRLMVSFCLYVFFVAVLIGMSLAAIIASQAKSSVATITTKDTSYFRQWAHSSYRWLWCCTFTLAFAACSHHGTIAWPKQRYPTQYILKLHCTIMQRLTAIVFFFLLRIGIGKNDRWWHRLRQHDIGVREFAEST